MNGSNTMVLRSGKWHALLVAWALLLQPATAALAHIGSPDTFFEGQAGPFPVRVIVRSPGVIPGQSEVTVSVKDGIASSVSVRPVVWNAGVAGAPPAEAAQPIRGQEDLFNVSVWLMTSSSYSLYIEVQGDLGEGTAIVPIQAIATQRLEMHPGMQWMLAGLGALLFCGAVSLVGAAVRESVVAPGRSIPSDGRRRARWAMLGTTVVLAFGLYGGKLWWASANEAHEQRMFKGFAIDVTSHLETSGHQTLRLEIQDDEWRARNWTPLIPDHGKLMHMFLMRIPEHDAFAHLHPVQLDEDTFEVDVSSLPAGQYQVYADVTHGSGFTQTLSDRVELVAAPAGGAKPRLDALSPDTDDSWMVAPPSTDSVFRFEDGFSMSWDKPSQLVANIDFDLDLQLTDASGLPAELENYMGMMSHAAVRQTQGDVFVHLHPTGTVSMAAAELFRTEDFKRRESTPPASTHGEADRAQEPLAGDSDTEISSHDSMDHSGHASSTSTVGRVTMPYAFPRSGDYRIWVQVKSGGSVYTASFAASVDAVEALSQP